MSYRELWTVNVWEETLPVHDEVHNKLHQALLPHIDKYNGIPEIFDNQISIPNLFNESDPIIQDFKRLIKDRVYKFLEIEGFINPKELEVEINAFPRKYTSGTRARVHTHRGVDYVGVFYVDLDEHSGEDDCDSESGKLLLVDPIAQRSRGLNHKMLHHIIPKPKFLVIHPSYVFHQAELYTGKKDKLMIVMNIRVKDRQQANSFITL